MSAIHIHVVVVRLQLRILLLCACACLGGSEPLKEAIKSRSEAFLVYANSFANEYEPIAFAALPLHPPLPVVHMLSTKPGAPRAPRPAALASSLTPVYHRPDQRQPEEYYRPEPYHRPADTYQESLYRGPDSYHADVYRPYASQYYPQQYEESERVITSPSEILYARPDPYGGYTYYRKPTGPKRPPAKKVVKKRPKPVIVRIHKYRVVRDK